MSNTAMHRQVARLKNEVQKIKPQPPRTCKLMGRPPDDASNRVKAAYRAEFAAALAAGVFVIQLVPL